MSEAASFDMAAAAALVNPEAIHAHIEALFRAAPPGDEQYVELRGVPEKGTKPAQEGGRPVVDFLELDDLEVAGQKAVTWALRWAKAQYATYLTPAILSQPDGHASSVAYMTSLLIDLDTGDTTAKLRYLQDAIGDPSMVVISGGTTELGKQKLHAYWLLAEATADVEGAAATRHLMALKVGGDASFQRSTQIIRLAGSCHGKGGVLNGCRFLLEDTGARYDYDELAAQVDAMSYAPWATAAPVAAPARLDFDPTHGKGDLAALVGHDVHQEGEGETTRYAVMSKLIGVNISHARLGNWTLAEARQNSYDWMQARMVPPWPDGRFAQEWDKLVLVDERNHGPLEDRRSVLQPLADRSAPLPPAEERLEVIAYHRWRHAEKPRRRFLVEGLIQASKHHVLVAEGGAGKTQALLDLAIKIAAPRHGDTWLGSRVLVTEPAPVLIITTEDDEEELDIRLRELDPDGRALEAGDRLMILSTLDRGGAFTLAARSRDGNIEMSERWKQILALIHKMPVKPALVVLDTMNTTLHGDENSATVINEYVRQATKVCGTYRSALIVTHHIGKRKDAQPIKSAEEMREAMRGSSATVAAFRINLGIWHAHDYEKRMEAMHMTPKKNALWRFAVLKANNPEMFPGTRTLLRSTSGLLLDVTDKDRALEDAAAERRAWLRLAVGEAAMRGYPYVAGSKNCNGGLYRRRAELPPAIAKAGVESLERWTKELLDDKRLVLTDAGGHARQFLDAAGGPLATAQERQAMGKGSYSGHEPDWRQWRWNPYAAELERVD